MAQQVDWKTLSEEVAADRRGGKRVAITYSVTVSGVTPDGDPFLDKTRTTNVSEHGCCFESERLFQLGEIVTITLTQGAVAGHHRFQVVRVVPDTVPNVASKNTSTAALNKDTWLVGARLVQSTNIWGVVFPPKHRLRKPGE
jgi:PilZ domain